MTWAWSADVPHNIDGGSFTSGGPSASGNFSFRFTAPGTYSYQCDVHPDTMQGTITVQ